ncbi:MAG: hypothetical protein MSD82_04555, partial [Prevotella sp.]|nr:hypothetical protein [Prevotella sp.]
HLVEYVGALSILDFLSIPDDQLQTSDGNALNPIYKEYGLANDKMTLSLKDFGLSTRSSVNRQMVKFYLSYLYVTHQLKSDIGRGFTQDKPEITNGFLSTSFYATLTANFYVAYRQWLKEMRGNQRSFMPFNLDTDKLSEALTDMAPKAGFFKSAIDYKTLLAAMNKESQQAVRNGDYGSKVALKLMDLLDKTLDKLIDEKYNGII